MFSPTHVRLIASRLVSRHGLATAVLITSPSYTPRRGEPRPPIPDPSLCSRVHDHLCARYTSYLSSRMDHLSSRRARASIYRTSTTRPPRPRFTSKRMRRPSARPLHERSFVPSYYGLRA